MGADIFAPAIKEKEMPFKVTLTRTTERNVSSEKLKSQVDRLVERSFGGNRGNGWVARVGEHVSEEKEFGVIHTFPITYKKTGGHQKIAPRQWNKICSVLITCGQNSIFGNHPWLVTGQNAPELYSKLVEDGKIVPIASNPESPTMPSTPSGKSKEFKAFGEINIDLGRNFDHIYGREHQIKIVHSALVAAKESDFINRFHCVLQGPPGCGKTDILKSVGTMLGKEGEAYMVFDATSTTEAGAQRLLLDSDFIPPVLIVEEIEKTDEKSLRWLLGILDHRAEIRKTNFKIGHRAKNVKMLCLATVNNIKLFRKVMSGALYSRFAHSIYCPRPDRQCMFRILEREVLKVNGKMEWIEPTLKFCMDEQKIDDPRKIIPVCLCGRDDLLNNSYQESILLTQRPKKTRRVAE